MAVLNSPGWSDFALAVSQPLDDDDFVDCEPQPQVTGKRKRSQVEWQAVDSLFSADAVEQQQFWKRKLGSLFGEQGYQKQQQYNSKDGAITVLQLKCALHHKMNCPFMVRVEVSAQHVTITSKDDHEHSAGNDRSKALPLHIKDFLLPSAQLGMQPKKMLQLVRTAIDNKQIPGTYEPTLKVFVQFMQTISTA